MASIHKKSKISDSVVYYYKNKEGERKQKWETYRDKKVAEARSIISIDFYAVALIKL